MSVTSRFMLAAFTSCVLNTQPALAQGLQNGPEGRCNWEAEKFVIDKKENVVGRWQFAEKCFSSRIHGNLQMDLIFKSIDQLVANWHDNESRPAYPSFISEDNTTFWAAPTNLEAAYTGKDLKKQSRPNTCLIHKEPFPTYIKLCQAGCARGNQMVLFTDGYHRLSDALQFSKSNVVTLDPLTSVFNNDGRADLHFSENRVSHYTQDLLPDMRNDVVIITTLEGGRLDLTPSHPLVSGDGRMVRADSLKAGSKILHISGEIHTVANINSQSINEKVLNLDVVTREETSEIYVIQGYLSGSRRQQEADLESVNRSLFREQLPSLAGLVD